MIKLEANNSSIEQNDTVHFFEDLKGKDLSQEDLSNTPIGLLTTLDFDTETVWPPENKLPSGFNPDTLLEINKNPGLGIRELHQRGITGQGIVVAIIDQKLDTTHPEYKDSISDYIEYGSAERESVSMHGPAVASLLVGKSCGVAPGAKLIYSAVPSGRDFHSRTRALNDIIEHNKNIPESEKIRVVSCSIGYMIEKPEPGLDDWVMMLNKAKDSGILVVDVGGAQVNVSFTGGGTPNHKDDFDKYLPWLLPNKNNIKKYLVESQSDENTGTISRNIESTRIVIPTDYRTLASSWHKQGQYMYTGVGGMSWAVPYLAGLFALTLQVNPDLKWNRLSQIINQSAVVNKIGLRIINPIGVIKTIQDALITKS